MSVKQKLSEFGSSIKRRWKLILLLLIILGIAGFFIYRQQTAQKVRQTYIQPKYDDIVETLDVSGVIDAKEKASLRFAAGGKLTYLSASEGAILKRGQVIARIDSADLQKRLQQDLNNYFKERLDFEQSADDRRDIAPTNELNRNSQQDQKDLENSVLNVEIQQIAVRNASLVSPFAGILVSVPSTTVGSNLLSTDVFEVVNPESLIFRATIDQADVAKVKKDQPVEVILDPYQDETITSRISYVSLKSSQSSTGTVYVIEIPLIVNTTNNPLEKFRLGMNGDAQIELNRHDNVLTIPLNATRERDGKTFVQVKGDDGKPVEREIQVGLQNENDTEVTNGLTENDQVLVP